MPIALNDLYSKTLLIGNRAAPGVWHIPTQLMEPDGTKTQITIRNSRLKAGHIYALVLPRFTPWWANDDHGKQVDSGVLNLVINVMKADADGNATFRTYPATQPFKLVGTEDAFSTLVAPYEHEMSSWTEEHPAPALLLELSGKFGRGAYQVLEPDTSSK